MTNTPNSSPTPPDQSAQGGGASFITIPEEGVSPDKWMRVGPHYVINLQRQLAAAKQEVEEVRERDAIRQRHHEANLESDSIVASCGCTTKTNEAKYHKPGCKYRLICERDEARAKLERQREISRQLAWHEGDIDRPPSKPEDANLVSAAQRVVDEYFSPSMTAAASHGALVDLRAQLAQQGQRNEGELLRELYTFPGVRDLLAPTDSLGNIAARIEAYLAARPATGNDKDQPSP